jgi:hypothetical protein
VAVTRLPPPTAHHQKGTTVMDITLAQGIVLAAIILAIAYVFVRKS